MKIQHIVFLIFCIIYLTCVLIKCLSRKGKKDYREQCAIVGMFITIIVLTVEVIKGIENLLTIE